MVNFTNDHYQNPIISSTQNPLKWIKNRFDLCEAVFLFLIVLLKQDKAGPEHKVQNNLGHQKLLQPLFIYVQKSSKGRIR